MLCTNCGGDGLVECPEMCGGDSECPVCDGYTDVVCDECDGTGEVDE